MCSVTTPDLNLAEVERFGDRLIGALNDGALGLMISVSHKTGLFDAIATMPEGTSVEIAERAGLVERYVRECLGALVCAGIVRYDAETRRYRLPAEHAALLTRDAAPQSLASTFQWLPLLSKVEDRIVECFRSGGGVPYEDYPHFHERMSEDSDQSVVSGLIEHVLPLAPDLGERLRKGARVLDVGCGSGHAVVRLAQAFPKSRFTGYDLCPEAIDRAREAAREADVDNVQFEVRDVTRLPEGATFDVVAAFDAIHDQAHPDSVLAGIRGALENDGLFLMQDIRASSSLEGNTGHPLATFLYTISCMHCMSVSLAQEGRGLGAVWGEELALEMLAGAGFEKVEVHRLDHDIMNNWYFARVPA